MIVKKVATKRSAAPKSRALHARDLCDYIAGPNAGDNDEKVEHRGSLNLLNIDHQAQVAEIGELAETARRSAQPIQHWILSWRQGEQPTADQADGAVRMFVGELGLAEHQVIYALHRDTDNYHLHLAINRVHPESERVVTVNRGFDLEIAHRAIARIEHAQGWEREANGRYQVLAHGELSREPAVDAAPRQPSTRARDLEIQSGDKSAQRKAIEEAAEVLRKAADWREIHARLAEREMRIEPKGSGAILWVGDVAVKASTAGRDCSLSALEKRLGEFVPPEHSQDFPRRASEPLVVAARGWSAYFGEREAHFTNRKEERASLNAHQRDEWARLADQHRGERHQVFEADWRGKGDALNAIRSVLAARQAQEKAALKEECAAEREKLRERFPRFPTFEDWQRQRLGREAADAWRFTPKTSATPGLITGEGAEVGHTHDIRDFIAAVKGREVHYHRLGEPDQKSFVDRGRVILIHDLERDSVRAALQLSAQKWKSLHVSGSETYLRQCVELAAEHGFRISNPELAPAIEAERERRSRERELHRDRHPD